ncbi:MAG: Rpn family recombination-promoting nuclease/putative transposase [Microcystis aeruginosa Ma_AC_P_19900807_S299]|jgi:predicted transposase/invertase (TIGR01784 family)|uniref:Rpn family recombination-promoting nuclease/putative transposase n=1 Tax=Microcystis aeruginosa Ma_SC_T_19800800_S464 TaxID=2486257 RepID=A0A552E2V1_MICAE|nr:MAG: Rpn family recombination-promoting nuclease/putative transposase [Microcystis aeruginosa Ma_AC_P_19900807_S299]TRU28820.1 MAG: Rpn family recombination-promoting nuclease/putative transposase [Microcystis aeruginosa Ma_SC_T_19800800_S464]
MYDSTCKFIALEYSRDLATWLVGKPLDLTEIKPSELSLEPIRADSLIFLESEELILHIEFQTDPKEDVPYRMLDYAVRLYRRYPGKPIYQVVIYLRKTDSPRVRQNEYRQGKTYHQFEVIRLWEQPSEPLLQAPGLFPFAILAQAEDQENLLRQIAQEIEQMGDHREQSNVAASTAILAGLVLNKEIIQRLLRKDIMKESVIYQDIRDEGRQEGRQEGEANLVLRLLNRRIGGISSELSAKIPSLSLEQLENLGEALLDFQSRQDLEQWLENQAINPR